MPRHSSQISWWRARYLFTLTELFTFGVQVKQFPFPNRKIVNVVAAACEVLEICVLFLSVQVLCTSVKVEFILFFVFRFNMLV